MAMARTRRRLKERGSAHRRRDPHKATNVVAAIDEQGELVEQETFASNRKGLRALQRWAKRFPERSWAVEGASGIGRPLAQKLLAADETVVDVPPKLSSRVRVLSTGNARKNDALDATFTALAALRNDRLASVQPEDGPQGHAEILRLLTERREDLVCERTRALNRLHVLLRDLLSNPVRKQLSTDAAAKLLRRARPKRPAGRIRRGLASELVRDVRRSRVWRRRQSRCFPILWKGSPEAAPYDPRGRYDGG
jgi:transposase